MIQVLAEYRLRVDTAIQLAIVVRVMLYADLGEFMRVARQPSIIDDIGKFESDTVAACGRADKDRLVRGVVGVEYVL